MLKNMGVFVEVSTTGSFIKTARKLQLSTASVSRAIATLESHLGSRLLNRTTRRVSLTDFGKSYLKNCVQILDHIVAAEDEVATLTETPAGKLKISAALDVGVANLVSIVKRYTQLYPSTTVQLSISEGVPDLVEEGYDVVITVANSSPAQGLTSYRVAELHSVLCAAPRYLEANEPPKAIEDLSQHRCLQLVNSTSLLSEWQFSSREGTTTVKLPVPIFQVNRIGALVVAAKEGMGISLLPRHIIADELRSGALVHILDDYRTHDVGVYASHISNNSPSLKISTWIRLLSDMLPELIHKQDIIS
jgi:DNA-binding transcriptional LysR family regulator